MRPCGLQVASALPGAGALETGWPASASLLATTLTWTCAMSQPSVMTRRFTVDDANRTLPLVSRIVRDILDHYQEWHRTVEAFEVANAVMVGRGDQHQADAERLQHRAQALAQEIQGFLGELTDLDVEFKGFEKGLVDFPGVIDGRLINWCWKYGEPTVSFWHEADAGYDSRQPIEAIPLASYSPR